MVTVFDEDSTPNRIVISRNFVVADAVAVLFGFLLVFFAGNEEEDNCTVLLDHSFFDIIVRHGGILSQQTNRQDLHTRRYNTTVSRALINNTRNATSCCFMQCVL